MTPLDTTTRILPVLAAVAMACACGDAGLLQPEDPPDPGLATVLASDQAGGILQDRPFHANTTGRAVGQIFPAPAGRCPPQRPILFVYRGEGRGTHLGSFTVEGSECVFMIPGDPTSIASGEGRFMLRAANGDELYLAYDQTVVTLSPPPSPWLLWSATPYVTGGTGRFARAEMVGVTWQGGANLMTFETYSSMDGYIRYRASDRAERF